MYTNPWTTHSHHSLACSVHMYSSFEIVVLSILTNSYLMIAVDSCVRLRKKNKQILVWPLFAFDCCRCFLSNVQFQKNNNKIEKFFFLRQVLEQERDEL
jgi:hypothetical protein